MSHACVICGGLDNLVCCRNVDCYVAVHLKCSEELYRVVECKSFCCPYCSWKGALSDLVNSRREEKIAQKNLEAFINFEPDGGKSDENENGGGVGEEELEGDEKDGGSVVVCHDDVLEEKDNEDNGEGIGRKNDENVVEGDKQVETDLMSFRNGGEEVHELVNHHGGVGQKEHKDNDKNGDFTLIVLDDDSEEKDEEDNGEEIGQKREERVVDVEKQVETNSVSFKDGSGEESLSDCDSETVAMYIKCKRERSKAPMPLRYIISSDISDSELIEKKKENLSNQFKKSEESSSKITNMQLAIGKRKRACWTSKEEETLKEGVHKFSSMVNKNIPWRKILELGCHIFDSSRTPTDLKDKWRTMAR